MSETDKWKHLEGDALRDALKLATRASEEKEKSKAESAENSRASRSETFSSAGREMGSQMGAMLSEQHIPGVVNLAESALKFLPAIAGVLAFLVTERKATEMQKKNDEVSDRVDLMENKLNYLVDNIDALNGFFDAVTKKLEIARTAHYILFNEGSGFRYTDPDGERSDLFDGLHDALTAIAHRQIENDEERVLYFQDESGETRAIPNWDPWRWAREDSSPEDGDEGLDGSVDSSPENTTAGDVFCAFCKKTRSVNAMVGPGDAKICNECVSLAAKIISTKDSVSNEDSPAHTPVKAAKKAAKKKATKKKAAKKKGKTSGKKK